MILFAVTLPLTLEAQAAQPKAPLDGFDQWATATMAEWHVPGMAVGVIKDGKVVLAKGYGYRDVETKLPVTERTLMAIGSNTKSFTVTVLGMLADEGKLSWDKPVRTYLPDFQLFDPIATQEMTARDLVTHRSGLPRHDNLWYGRGFTRKELYDRLRYLQPSYSFRSRYQYQNLMFMTAGYLAEQLTGRSWDDLIRDRIFTPLGMTRAVTSVNAMPKADDFAYAYGWRDKTITKLPYRNIDAIGPAGSIDASVEDMLKYVQFRLDKGVAGGKRLLSEAMEQQMQSPQMVTGGQVMYDETGYTDYGMGLGIGSYQGHVTVGHGGGIDGFISAINWMPFQKIGIVVLTNQGDGNPVPTMVVKKLYDRLLGREIVDWVGRQRKQDAEGEARQEKERQKAIAERKPNAAPTHPLDSYAGTYEHPGYGRLTVRSAGGALELDMDATHAKLNPFHYDIFEIDSDANVVPFRGRVQFGMDKKGDIDRVAIPIEPAVADIVFIRKP
ncbi:MAG: serine hydrolase [Gemmatimonadota bacterium]